MTHKTQKFPLFDSTNTFNNQPKHDFGPIPNQKPKAKLSKEVFLPNYPESTGASCDETRSSSSRGTSSVCSQQEIFSPQYDQYFYPPQEEEVGIVLNSALRAKKKVTPDDEKYKTELCKNWIEQGRCNYGKKCRFAHGRHELVEKNVKQKIRYRSRQCNTFFTTGMCPYGVRCMFAHEQRTLAEINSEYHYSKFLKFPEFMECAYTCNKKRLPIFENLANCGNVEGTFTLPNMKNVGANFLEGGFFAF